MPANKKMMISKKEKRFLITTPLEDTWKFDRPVVFLGEWCRIYDRRHIWEKMDARLMPFHWDDRHKMYTDYQYERELYERVLPALGDHLNEIHSIAHSTAYWRIVLGPWLGYFIQILHDRWYSIKQALESYDITGSVFLSYVDEDAVPNGMHEFHSFYQSDDWNHIIYAMLLKRYGIDGVEEKTRAAAVPRAEYARPGRIKATARFVFSRLKTIFSTDRYVFCFGLKTNLNIYINSLFRWKQIPAPWDQLYADPISFDIRRRQWKLRYAPQDEFERLICDWIPLHLPKIYLEGYDAAVTKIKSSNWPHFPRMIMTDNALNADDHFKIYTAEHVTDQVPLYIAQHGGFYGTGKWGFNEEHEISISTNFLSWGWRAERLPGVIPYGNMNYKEKRKPAIKGDKLVIVLNAPHRYSYWQYSTPIGRQFLDYFDDQCEFIETLSTAVRCQLVLRLYIRDYRWHQKERFQERFSDVKIDDGKIPYARLLGSSKIFVSTYNATTFLETLAMDIPTVMVWRPDHSELREQAVPHFELLKKVGIFHESAESAAVHINAVWDDVDGWWQSRALQQAVTAFCDIYNRKPAVDFIDLPITKN
jgi:putative transferase (TIGR04331 family)